MINTEDIKKILVTGAAGFIGSHLTRRLIEDGFQVAITQRKDSSAWRIRDILDNVTVCTVDLKNTQDIQAAVGQFKPDVIFHLAAYYAVEHKPAEIPLIIDTNVLGTMNLLEAAYRAQVKLFVNTSSLFVYRDSRERWSEESPLNPFNLYALTKIHSEEACSFYAAKYGLRSVTFRIFPPYGPADNQRRFIPHIITSLLKGESPRMTTGRQEWDFIYVGDIVDAYVKLLTAFPSFNRHEVFNVGTGQAVSIRKIGLRLKEIIKTDAALLWGTIEHRKNEAWFVCADVTKAKTLLGWQPRVNILEEGLPLTVEWYRQESAISKKGGIL